MGREFTRHESHREYLEYNEKEIGNLMQCKKDDTWNQLCERGIV